MQNTALLTHFATKYLWWKSPADALRQPHRIIAQVMNLGTWDDVTTIMTRLSQTELINILHTAGPGIFSDRSWHYWHYKLGVTAPNQMCPAQPQRCFS